jgi:hypothetical protein
LKSLEKCKLIESNLRNSLRNKKRKNSLSTGRSEIRSCKKLRWESLKKSEIEIETLQATTNFNIQRKWQKQNMILEKSRSQPPELKPYLTNKRNTFITMQRQ